MVAFVLMCRTVTPTEALTTAAKLIQDDIILMVKNPGAAPAPGTLADILTAG